MIKKKRRSQKMNSNKKNWGPLHHRLNRMWIPMRKELEGKRLLLAFSAGLDSSIGASLMIEVGVVYGMEFGLAYIHHGDSQQKKYRDQALQTARQFATEYKVPFYTRKAKTKLKSEQDYREFRYGALQSIQQKNHFDWIVTFHHLQDQLETRLLHLIRGSGVQGLLGMQEFNQSIWRPFLGFEKTDFMIFNQKRNIRFIEDPSNKKINFKRNWLRERWLSELEKKYPGSLKSLSRSLSYLAEELSSAKIESMSSQSNHIPVLQYKGLELKNRKKWIINCLRFNKQNSFSATQIEEILKQLDIRKKSHIFEVAGIRWVVNAGQIQALKLV